MDEQLTDLPPELRAKLLTFLRESNGEFEVVDMQGLVQFISEHAEQHPVLLRLVQVNEDVILEHFKQTGEVPPGIKLIKTTTPEGSNVTYLEIFHGPKSERP